MTHTKNEVVMKTELKIFMSNGVTLTVSEKSKINGKYDMYQLYEYLKKQIEDERHIEFECELEDGIKHHYYIPFEKLTWFMIQEV